MSEDEIREEIDRLNDEKDAIRLQTLAAEGEIDAINARLAAGKHADSYVREMVTRRHRLRADLNRYAQRMIPIKARLRVLGQACSWSSDKKKAAALAKVAEQIAAAKATPPPPPPPVEPTAERIVAHVRDRLLAIRAEYAAFSQDPTRVSSMRLMASQFTEKLTALLREVPK